MQLQKDVKASGLSEGGPPSEGGVLVPDKYLYEILSPTLERSKIFEKCTKFDTGTSSSLRLPLVAAYDHSSSSWNGDTSAYIIEEGGAKTATKPEFALPTFNLKKIVQLVYLTDELFQDSPIAGGTYMQKIFIDSLHEFLDSLILNGVGGGQPLGITNAPATITQIKDAGQVASTLTFSNLMNMYSRIFKGNFDNLIWLANHDVIPQLYGVNVSVGTGGAPVFIQGPQGNFLFGVPLHFTEHCQTLGTVGDIMLADFSAYGVAQKSELIQIAISIHVNFATDESVLRFVIRMDGQPLLSGPITPSRSTTTISPFVVLETRS
jgi:HK97 family phage major capsid protein